MKKKERQPGKRPRDKDATRARLLTAAAKLFNRDGYSGTNSNRLARAAGYAPGTFYQHFADKRDCFLQVYQSWVDDEWDALSRILAEGGPADELARRIVDTVVSMHKKWHGLRGGLRALYASDEGVRRYQQVQRRRQLGLLDELRSRYGTASRSRADDVLLLLAMERVADALADGEAAAIEAPERGLREALHRLVMGHLTDSPATPSRPRTSGTAPSRA